MKGFLIHDVEGGYVPPFEYYSADGLTPKIGMAVALTGGKLVAATGTTKPTHIAMCERSAACADGELIPVIAVSDRIIFAVPTSVANTVTLGSKVTIGDDSLTVTATTTSGIAAIVGREGTAADDIQYVKFN